MEKFPGYEQFEIELRDAISARQAGNEGKARVCARRAVGIIVGEHLRRQSIHLNDPSAYNRIRYLISMDNISEDLRETAQHFVTKVTTDLKLPDEVDLIADALWMKNSLLRNGQ